VIQLRGLGEGQGKSKITSSCSCEVFHCSVDIMEDMEKTPKTVYPQGKSQEFVADWFREE